VNNLYRKIPKIDTFINRKEFQGLSRPLLTKIVKNYVDKLREDIKNKKIEDIDIDEMALQIIKEYKKILEPSIRAVINATGITVHTNLGRSLIDENIFEKAKDTCTSYCNLEFDMDIGKRGDRYKHTSKHLSFLFGCEDVLVVNNNAAAVFLILNTFAKDKEVIVSRGELVEIGGSFRIPEVMKSTQAKLIEVGTTNKTKLSDYENAINENSAMLMKVHKSNYSIEGFSEEVGIEEITKLAKTKNLLDYYDLGSAYLPTLPYNLKNAEPSIFDILKNSPSLLSFSGDKLFGSIQAGIIIGKKELIAKLKKNQILRMFRVDKLTLSILENTAISYIKESYEDIPSLKMIFQDIDTLSKRAKKIKEGVDTKMEIKNSDTYIGGGTFPNRKIPTVIIELDGDAIDLQSRFREKDIIGRIENDKFVLDMRTVRDIEIDRVISVIKEVAS